MTIKLSSVIPSMLQPPSPIVIVGLIHVYNRLFNSVSLLSLYKKFVCFVINLILLINSYYELIIMCWIASSSLYCLGTM